MPLMAEPRKPGRPSKKRVRKGYTFAVYIDPRIGEAVERFLDEHEPRTDKTALAEMALKKLLTEFGYWPPPPPPETP